MYYIVCLGTMFACPRLLRGQPLLYVLALRYWPVFIDFLLCHRTKIAMGASSSKMSSLGAVCSRLSPALNKSNIHYSLMSIRRRHLFFQNPHSSLQRFRLVLKSCIFPSQRSYLDPGWSYFYASHFQKVCPLNWDYAQILCAKSSEKSSQISQNLLRKS